MNVPAKNICFLVSFTIIAFKLFTFAEVKAQEKDKAQEINLPIPNLSQESIITYKVGARPYRTTGIRLEPEYWHNKLIIHDYGHGGAGISLSRGSARISLEILMQEISFGFRPRNQQIAILGSGIIGLTTAHLLADHGWQVHIYASQFPPHTTSNIAPGLWSKVVVGDNQSEASKQQLERIMELSFRDFKALAESTDPEFIGVSPLDIYTFKPRSPMKSLPDDIIAKGMLIKASFGNGPRKAGFYYRSLLVDTSLYIPQLYEKAQAKGVKFTQKTFHSKEELAHLSESIIFNCTGLGSRELFGDNDLIPVTGQLIELQPQEGLNYMLSGPLGKRCDLYIIPIHNKLILGGSYQFNVEACQPNIKLCEEILEHARNYFNH